MAASRATRNAASIHHSVDCTATDTHHVRVTTRFRGFDGEALVAALPNWTPGSYMIRDYARHVRTIVARDLRGHPLPCEKVRKNAWRIAHGGLEFTLELVIFAFELTVRTSYLDAERASLTGASLFVHPDGRTDLGATVSLALPKGWGAECALRRDRGGNFSAANYDELVDSPILAGRLRVASFRVHGIDHRFAVAGDGTFPLAQVCRDTHRIIDEARKIFGTLPYEDFRFLVNLGQDADGSGGLEHARSTVLQVPRWSLRDAARYRTFLGLVAHEFFHVWNVKRIHDRVLGPFDYERETLTSLLWFHEGFTAYYDDLLPTRAGVFSVKDWLELLAENLNATLTLGGESVQSLSESSIDAWVKFYKRNEESRSATVSYYTKGSAFALVLDAEIRRRTSDRRTLDDVMRTLDRDAGRKKPLDRATFEDAVRRATGVGFGAFIRRYVDRPTTLPLRRALATLGLVLRPKDDRYRRRAWLGVVSRTEPTRTIVEEVLTGSPAEAAGIHPRDEFVGLGGWRVGGDLEAVLARHSPGDTIDAVLLRGDRVLTRIVHLGVNPRPPLAVSVDPRASASARRRFRSWCGQALPER